MANIARWIDLESEEFKQVEHHAWIKRFTLRGIELGAISATKDGKLYAPDGTPIHAELGKELVGLRHTKLAAN